MRNLHKISTAILLVLVGFIGGYFLFSAQSGSSLSMITGNVVGDGQDAVLEDNEEVIVEDNEELLEEFEEIPAESVDILNNPPANKEDYLDLLGEIDYDKTYDLFFSAEENDSALNYSERPIEDVIDYLDKFLFWEDKKLYSVGDYWASPVESLDSMKGDDEDYALLGLALFNNFHDKNQTCYLIGNEEFTGLFCYMTNYKKYYGEMVIDSYTFHAVYSDNWWQSAGDVWLSQMTLNADDGYTENLVRAELRNFIKEFMIDKVGYCCTDYWKNDVEIDYENRDKLKFMYNEDEFYDFETTKDLENWMYELIEDRIFGQGFVR